MTEPRHASPTTPHCKVPRYASLSLPSKRRKLDPVGYHHLHSAIDLFSYPPPDEWVNDDKLSTTCPPTARVARRLVASFAPRVKGFVFPRPLFQSGHRLTREGPHTGSSWDQGISAQAAASVLSVMHGWDAVLIPTCLVRIGRPRLLGGTRSEL